MRAIALSLILFGLTVPFHNCAPVGSDGSASNPSKANLTFPQLYLSQPPGATPQVPEGSAAVLRAEIQSVQSQDVAVLVELTRITATLNVDVRLPVSRIVIPAGQNYTDFALEAMADATIESNETVSVKLKYEDDPQVSSPLTITVLDGTPLPRLTYSSITVKEGASANFVVQTALAAQNDITFNVVSKAGTAKEGTDYTKVNRVAVKIPKGQTSVSIPVSAVKDNVEDPNETFTLEISNVVGAQTPVAVATVTITDGAVLPTVTLSAPRVVEGSVLKFDITLSIAPKTAVSLKFDTMNGTALAGTHFRREVGTLTFPVGVRTGYIQIQSYEVRNQSGTKTFTLKITDITNATNTGVNAIGTILDSGR